jgi:hypothetical protein
MIPAGNGGLRIAFDLFRKLHAAVQASVADREHAPLGPSDEKILAQQREGEHAALGVAFAETSRLPVVTKSELGVEIRAPVANFGAYLRIGKQVFHADILWSW